MFFINGIQWRIRYVPAFSEYLQRSDGSFTIGMTDGVTNEIFICDKLHGEKLRHVVCHETVHAFCFSYGVSFPIEFEERLCNFVADYGEEILALVDDLLAILRMSA